MKNIKNFEDFNIESIDEIFGLFKKKNPKKDDELVKKLIRKIKNEGYSEDVITYTTYPTIVFEVEIPTESEIKYTQEVEIYMVLKLEEWRTGNDVGVSIWKLFLKKREELDYQELEVSDYLLEKLRKTLYKLKSGGYDRRHE